MTDPELQALASDVRILSLIFSALDFNWRSPRPKEEQAVHGLTKTLAHISTILSFDASVPVAVLGSATPQSVNIIAVQAMPTGSRDQPTQPFIVHPVTPSIREMDDILREDDESETAGVETLISECLVLFAARQERTLVSRAASLIFLSRSGASAQHLMIYAQIFQWLVARDWDFVCDRLQRSRDNFLYGDMFELMENWSPALVDIGPPVTISLPPSYVYVKYGAQLNVSSTPEEWKTFSLERDTASLLINILGRILKDLRQTAERDPEDFATAHKSVADSLLFLFFVIKNKAVERLFTETSLSRVLAPAWSRDHTENVTQALQDGWDPLTTADHTFDGTYALRYLRMLASCAHAVIHTAFPSTLRGRLATADIFVVSVFDPEARLGLRSRPDRGHHKFPPEYMQQAREEAIKWFRELEAKAREKDGSTCTIHAEAAAMALVCDARSRPMEARELGRDGYGTVGPEVPICVGQRCCALCSRLCELLNDHHLGDGGLQFVLPGTHDVILPWEPPPFGIPQVVLRQLRDELRDKLAEHAVVQGGRTADMKRLKFQDWGPTPLLPSESVDDAESEDESKSEVDSSEPDL